VLFGEEEIHNQATPQAFLWSSEIVSQNEAWSAIESVLKSGRFPHCSLIRGSQGSGALAVALSLAQNLLCRESEIACGHCPACYKAGLLIHPDMHFSFPVFGAGEICLDHYTAFRTAAQENPWMSVQSWLSMTDSENKQANITAREARSIIERLYLKPFEADKNVMIVWLAEFLGKESNILLKLLEEPPGHAYIILVTEDPTALLPTVLSRTQQFRLRPLQDADVANALVRKLGLEYVKAMSVALSAEGNLPLALELAGNEGAGFLKWIQQMLQAAYKKDPAEMWAWMEQVASLNRDNQRRLFAYFLMILSLSMRIGQDAYPREQLQHSAPQYAERLAQRLGVDKILQINTLVNECSYGIMRNANIRILLHDFLIKLAGIIR
jgi:DNA polymerase-3 subunit delta'